MTFNLSARTESRYSYVASEVAKSRLSRSITVDKNNAVVANSRLSSIHSSHLIVS